MVVLVGQAPLSGSTGMVHGARSAGHSVTVVVGVGGVVGVVGVVEVMVPTADERRQRFQCSDGPDFTRGTVLDLELLDRRGGWRRRRTVGRGQAEGVAQQHVHLSSDLVDGRLGAERRRVGAAVSLHAQAAGSGAGRPAGESQRAHQAVNVGLLKWFRFSLWSQNQNQNQNDFMIPQRTFKKTKYSLCFTVNFVISDYSATVCKKKF